MVNNYAQGVPPRKPVRAKSIYKYVPGDWICPTCEDLQFRRNQSCRICGTMNPMVLAQELAIAAGKSLVGNPVFPQAMPQTVSKDSTAPSVGDHMPMKGKGKGAQFPKSDMKFSMAGGVPMAPAAPLYPNWDAGMPMMIPQDQNMSFAGFTHPNVQAAYLNAMQPQPFPQFAFPQPGGNMNMMMQMPFYAGAYSGEETCMPVMPMPTTTEQDMSYAGGRRPSDDATTAGPASMAYPENYSY
mmetsp:Transcript_11402/g.27839  ORF Transcript_11402/g.27839 Transcript_11402/m.27839 type:complete len:241 (-) Transcript_11402:2153-2875(-)